MKRIQEEGCTKFGQLILPQTPLEELTALPQTTLLDLRGPISKEGGQGRFYIRARAAQASQMLARPPNILVPTAKIRIVKI